MVAIPSILGRERRRRARLLARTLRTAPAVAALLLAAPVPSATAVVSQTRTLSYPLDQVFPTAVRYLRVDRGYTVVESDREAGFILFRFPVGRERTGDGSLEAFGVEDPSGRPATRVKISTGAGPAHLPYTLLNGLAAKIRAERGQPPPPPKSRPEPPADEPTEPNAPPSGIAEEPPATEP